jgi:peroxin-16
VKNLLGVIRNVEVLLEMLARKHCTVRDRWTAILGIEVVKAICKLYLLRNHHGHMLMEATHEEAKQQLVMEDAESRKDNEFGDIVQLYSRAGRGVHPHGRFSSRVDSVNKASGVEVLAEFLHIMRPVVYVAGICARRGQQTWSPYIASLMTDVLSRILHMAKHVRETRQQSELRRRELLWFYYLMRSPFFERHTRRPLEKVTKQLGRLPLIGIIFANMTDLIAALQSHHFYTSAS